MAGAQTRILGEQTYGRLHREILGGEHAPGAPLRPQAIADRLGVSLAVVREALTRLSGEGLAERHTNRGFTVPAASDERWQELAHARSLLEPIMLRDAVEHGDLEWESLVVATHHRLAVTPIGTEAGGHVSEQWSLAHGHFHRALIEGCANRVMLDVFDRFWRSSELARRWSVDISTDRDIAGEHEQLMQAACDRDADRAQHLLREHILATVRRLRP
jgi:DNA-binding GntR family transcriptional regulator